MRSTSFTSSAIITSNISISSPNSGVVTVLRTRTSHSKSVTTSNLALNTLGKTRPLCSLMRLMISSALRIAVGWTRDSDAETCAMLVRSTSA